MLAQTQSLLEHLPSEALAAALILTIIGTFGALIIGVAMGIDAYKSIRMANITKSMIEDLLAKGYQPEEIERLIFGESKMKKVRRMFGFFKRKSQAGFRPMPPVKQPV